MKRPMGIRFEVANFRSLRKVDWSPDGVSVLVGPNGSGKSTLLDMLDFLRIAFQANLPKAIEHSGGTAFLKNLHAAPGETIAFAVTLGKYRWRLEFGVRGANLQGEELLWSRRKVILAEPTEPFFWFRRKKLERTDRLVLRTVADLRLKGYPEQLVDALTNFRVYPAYQLERLRSGGSPYSSDVQLEPSGQNAFTVLRNWRDKRAYRRAYDFVWKEMCGAFPGIADDLEFDPGGQANHLKLVLAEHVTSIPAAFASSGWLTGLLHLMAVAGAAPGSVIAFDEFENALHPYAVRSLVRGMREWSENTGLTVILAGHSSALLDEFRDDPGRVFVMEPGQPSMPVRLTDYRNPEWLRHFSLGELYRHEDFGGPKAPLTNGKPAISAS